MLLGLGRDILTSPFLLESGDESADWRHLRSIGAFAVGFNSAYTLSFDFLAGRETICLLAASLIALRVAGVHRLVQNITDEVQRLYKAVELMGF